MSDENSVCNMQVSGLSSSPIEGIQRPDLYTLSVSSETLKGSGIGAILGTLVVGTIACLHLAKGERPLNRNALEYLTKSENRTLIAKSIGIVAAFGGAASYVETISRNRIKKEVKPYVELLENQRKALSKEKVTESNTL